jgi:hypothetical protein
MKLSEIYQNSLTNRVMESIGRVYSCSFPSRFCRKCSFIYKNSVLHSILFSDKKKEQTYRYSIAFKVLEQIAQWLNNLCAFVCACISKYYKFSITAKTINVVSEEGKNMAAVLLFTSLGFALGKTLLKRWNLYSALLFVALLLLSIAATVPVSKWKRWYRQSFFTRILHFFFEV